MQKEENNQFIIISLTKENEQLKNDSRKQAVKI